MTASASDSAIEVFFSYSRRDEDLMKELVKHLSILKRQGVTRDWHDRQIGGGREWAGEIDRHLNSAQVILLLISSDFLASDYCYDIEMKRAMERHEAREARVVPIILRPVDWKGSPFSKLQGFPKDGKPVTSWTSRDEAFVDIARGIRALVEELNGAKEEPTSTAERTMNKIPEQPPEQPTPEQPANSEMHQTNKDKSTGYQINVSGGTVYVGSHPPNQH